MKVREIHGVQAIRVRGTEVTQCFVDCCLFLCPFPFWPLFFLSFSELQILITSLVSSNSSFNHMSSAELTNNIFLHFINKSNSQFHEVVSKLQIFIIIYSLYTINENKDY